MCVYAFICLRIPITGALQFGPPISFCSHVILQPCYYMPRLGTCPRASSQEPPTSERAVPSISGLALPFVSLLHGPGTTPLLQCTTLLVVPYSPAAKVVC